MKRLILNADDFGMTAGINRAVAEAHRGGALTSASMMAGGGALADAVTLAHSLPRLATGCHVVLLHGTPLSPPERVRSLIGQEGQFRRTFGRFAQAALAGELSAGEIEVEAGAQIERLRAAGLAVSHLDSHKHAHAFPAVFRPLLRAAREAGVRAMRNPFEPEFSASLTITAGRARRDPLPSLVRYAAVRGLAWFAADFRDAAKDTGIRTTDGTLAIAATARWEQSLLERMLARVPDGTWELICHPAYADEEFRRFSSAGGAGRTELDALTSPWFREAVARAGITLISYSEL